VAVRASVRPHSLELASPKQRQANRLPTHRLRAISTTKIQSRPAATGKKIVGSVPVTSNKANDSSATPRALPNRGLTREKTPKSTMAIAVRAGLRSLAIPLHANTIPRTQMAIP
jgi:hypothetical protein